MRHMSWLLVLLLFLAPVQVAAADDHASATKQTDISLISAVLAEVTEKSLSVDEDSDCPDSVSSNSWSYQVIPHFQKGVSPQDSTRLSRCTLNGIRAPPSAH